MTESTNSNTIKNKSNEDGLLISSASSSSSISNVSSSASSASRQATKTRIVSLANELLSMCANTTANNNNNKKSKFNYVPTKITNVKQVNSNLFVLFYEELCNTELVGKFECLVQYLGFNLIFIYLNFDCKIQIKHEIAYPLLLS